MEYLKSTGSQPPAMYLREIYDLKIKEKDKELEPWNWLWHKILGHSIPKVYSWLLHCKIEDNGFLCFTDIVDIHGIKYLVSIYGDHQVLETMSHHDVAPSDSQFKNAQVLYAGSSYLNYQEP